MQASKIVAVAESFIGVTESPAGSNRVVFNTHYYGREVSGSNFPWCCTFVWDVFRMAGAGELFCDGRATAYCPDVVRWGKSRTVKSGTAGDIVLFDFNGNGEADHIGIIVCRNSDGSYTTVEGNTSTGSDDNGGVVQRRRRYDSQILCIVRPDYEYDFVRQVQSAIGAAVDGIVGSETLGKTPTLSARKNRRHPAVRVVQKQLSALGYTEVGEIDGIAGKLFTQAVKRYQTEHGCVVDGEITAKEKTWRCLLGVN